MKNVLQINGVIQKVDGSEISEKEVEFIQDKILEILEEQDFMFGGSWLHQTTEDSLKEDICNAFTDFNNKNKR